MRIRRQSLATTARSSDMPTARKNRPSSRPRKGSMSASSWCRKADSDSSTPARKAPMAMDSPPRSISSAAPSTTSNAAAVITSRAPARARMRNSGLSSHRPAATRPTRAPVPSSTACQRVPLSGCAAAGARKATRASSGTISRSSNSRIETILRPRGRAMSPRSPNTCMTMAVEVSTKPAAARKDTIGARPRATPTPVIASAASPTCRPPSRKICFRSCHSCEGRISRPTTNRNITTPSSATCRMAAGSVNQASPKGPIARPAAR